MTAPRGTDEARAFGRGVGAVLLLIALSLFLRGRSSAVVPVTATVGAMLVVLGQWAPRLLRVPAAAWMRLALALAWISTRVVLTTLFFVVLTPIALVKRWRGFDPLDRRGAARGSYWVPYPTRQHDARYYERMF